MNSAAAAQQNKMHQYSFYKNNRKYCLFGVLHFTQLNSLPPLSPTSHDAAEWDEYERYKYEKAFWTEGDETTSTSRDLKQGVVEIGVHLTIMFIISLLV